MFGLSILTIFGNTVVIYALQTDRHLRTVGNLFILSLATADLIVGCFVMPIAGIYAIMEKWNMGVILCQIWLSVDYTASTASIFNLLTLSLDRYWSITSPLQYLGKRTRTRALLLIGFAWGLSLLWVIPIFGWNHFVNNNTAYIDPSKCEPGYTLSKLFKVTTAILNFYLPLLVLICLNGRIYYEIKRRYKNVLLQRHSTKITEVASSYKSNATRKNSHLSIAVPVCDNEKHTCSKTYNIIDNESLYLPKMNTDKNSKLRINFTENKTSRQSSLKPSYSYIESNHCPPNELTWLTQHHEHSRSSLSPLPTYQSHSKHRLNVDDRSYQTCRIYSNERRDSFQYYSVSNSRRCSFADVMRGTGSSRPMSPSAKNAKSNIFHLCHCCSSQISLNSNYDLYNNNNPTNSSRRLSSSSMTSTISRKQNTVSSYNLQRNSTSSNICSRSNSYMNRRSSNRIKQPTVWNQQEKAFRQLFAIVFGFTCCFLPYFILYMVVAFCGSCVSERIVTATIWLGYVNSTINPFLYALSNKHFRRTFHRIVKRDQRRQSYYN